MASSRAVVLDQEASPAAKTAPALFRKEAYQWPVGLNRMVEILTGSGLAQFVLTDDDKARVPTCELPCLVVAAAAWNWLMYEKKGAGAQHL